MLRECNQANPNCLGALGRYQIHTIWAWEEGRAMSIRFDPLSPAFECCGACLAVCVWYRPLTASHGLSDGTFMKPTRTLLRLPALLEKLGGVSAEFVDGLMGEQQFPKPLPVSRRVLLWDQGLVDEWIERKSREAQAA